MHKLPTIGLGEPSAAELSRLRIAGELVRVGRALLNFMVALLTIRWFGGRRSGRLGIGTLRVLLTLAFELALGRLILNLDWSRIASDYDLRHGGFMILGLVCLLFTPRVTARIRKIEMKSSNNPMQKSGTHEVHGQRLGRWATGRCSA